MITFVRRLLARYAELLWVLAAATLGLISPGLGRTLTRHDAVNIVLGVLVFAAALSVPANIAVRLRHDGARLLVVTALSSAAVVVLAWLASRMVEAGSLRLGVLAVGVAPVEIATLGVAPLGGGDSLSSGVMLVASTLLTALFAGPIIAALASGTQVHVGSVAITLLLVVVAPFTIGLAVRAQVASRVLDAAPTVAAVAVTVLVWLVASQARLSSAYGGVVIALMVLIAASAAVGTQLGRLVNPNAARSTIFATSMRDFAIAAGIATAAFGSAAAAPLGVYGILVMIWGTGLAGTLRHRPARKPMAE